MVMTMMLPARHAAFVERLTDLMAHEQVGIVPQWQGDRLGYEPIDGFRGAEVLPIVACQPLVAVPILQRGRRHEDSAFLRMWQWEGELPVGGLLASWAEVRELAEGEIPWELQRGPLAGVSRIDSISTRRDRIQAFVRVLARDLWQEPGRRAPLAERYAFPSYEASVENIIETLTSFMHDCREAGRFSGAAMLGELAFAAAHQHLEVLEAIVTLAHRENPDLGVAAARILEDRMAHAFDVRRLCGAAVTEGWLKSIDEYEEPGTERFRIDRAVLSAWNTSCAYFARMAKYPVGIYAAWLRSKEWHARRRHPKDAAADALRIAWTMARARSVAPAQWQDVAAVLREARDALWSTEVSEDSIAETDALARAAERFVIMATVPKQAD